MFVYEKKLEFPVKIKQTNPALAKLILTQYGGPYGNSVFFCYYDCKISKTMLEL
jgi:spore coat protein JC